MLKLKLIVVALVLATAHAVADSRDLTGLAAARAARVKERTAIDAELGKVGEVSLDATD